MEIELYEHNQKAYVTAEGYKQGKWLSEQRLILQGKREGKALTEEQKLASVSFTTEGRTRPGRRKQRQVQEAWALS